MRCDRNSEQAGLRAALVTDNYPPLVNGVAMTLERWAEGLAARGHAVEVVFPQCDGDPPIEQSGNPARFPVAGRAVPRYPSLRYGLPCDQLLLDHWTDSRPSLVHLATEGPLGLSALYAAKRLRLPIVSSFHTNFDQYGKYYDFSKHRDGVERLLRYLHNRTLVTMAPTRQMRDDLRDDGYTGVTVLGRGVDTELFSTDKRSAEIRRSWGVAGNEPVALHVGRVSDEKGIPLAIRAFEQAQRRTPDARMVVVGDGPAMATLRERHPSVRFVGRQAGEALAAHYASADLFVFPSLTETFGNVLMEAAASGLPLVAYDTGAAREHFTGSAAGRFAPPGDEQAFVEVAAVMLNDADARRSAGQRARAIAETQSWEGNLDRYERILQIACRMQRRDQSTAAARVG